MKRLILIALVVVALAPSQANAGLLGATTPRPSTQADWLSTAAEFWGAASTCPPSEVEIRWGPSGGAAGRAMLGGCASGAPVIWLNSDDQLPAWRWCVVVQHEYGHLLGHDHVDSPNSVMYPVADVGWRCAAPMHWHGIRTRR